MIIRKIDNLGRIVIPMEIRKELSIKEGQRLEIDLNNEQITVNKYQDKCVFCENNKSLTNFKNRKVCKKCLEELCK